MCNCIENLNTKTIDHLQEKNPGRQYEPIKEFEGDGVQGQIITFTGNNLLSTQFVARYKLQPSGKMRTDKLTISFTYCPFCGEKQN